MTLAPSVAPPRIFVRFAVDAVLTEETRSPQYRTTTYAVDDVRVVSGEGSDDILRARTLARIESEARIAPARGNLGGLTGHVLYTDEEPRRTLGAASASESGPSAVLIPIRKSAQWWAMAQDERSRCFHGKGETKGHYAIGLDYAPKIFRRLYHARYLPGAEWDFLTYFEFPSESADIFRKLLGELRDPQLNPEWAFVERELEVWLTKQ